MSNIVRVLVPISGGKDSQACLKLALQHFAPSEVRGLFCDTQFEHPETYSHISRLGQSTGVRIDRVCAGDVLERSERYGRFPGGGSRHCTDDLKIKPTKRYCKTLAERQGGFEVWYGMRFGEGTERRTRYAGKLPGEIYQPHEVMPSKYPKYLGRMGVRFRLPVLDWSALDVLEFLDGGEHPFYALGFDRIGCFPCLAAGDASKEKAFAFDDFGRRQLDKVRATSARIGKSIWTSKGGKFRNEQQGCLICAI